MAGVNGNSARADYCQKIRARTAWPSDGYYQTAEEIDAHFAQATRLKPWLEGDIMKITTAELLIG